MQGRRVASARAALSVWRFVGTNENAADGRNNVLLPDAGDDGCGAVSGFFVNWVESKIILDRS